MSIEKPIFIAKIGFLIFGAKLKKPSFAINIGFSILIFQRGT